MSELQNKSWLLKTLARIDHNGFGRAQPAALQADAPLPEGMPEETPAAQPASQQGAVASAVFGIIRKNKWG